MRTFLGLQVDQVHSEIHLHMDNYVSTILSEYKDFIRKKLRPKSLPVAPNLQLVQEVVNTGRMVAKDPLGSHFRSFVMKLQYISHAVS